METQPALAGGVNSTFLGASLDQGLGAHWTVVGMLGEQYFSDSNHRDHRRGKVIYQPSLDSDLTLQLRYRYFRSSAEPTDAAYFNPGRYDEAMHAVGWRKRLHGWTLRLTACVGTQHVDEDSGALTRLLELGLESPFRGDKFVRLRAGYQQSASNFGSDYSYSYFQGEWIKRF